MLEEKVFKRLMIAVTIIVIAFVAISYVSFYSKQPELNKANVTQSKDNIDTPLSPFDAFSMLKEDLISKLGKGQEGNGSDFDNQYVDYKQKWFGKEFNARYFYGSYNRIYQINLTLEKNDLTSMYQSMKNALGTTIKDTFLSDTQDLDEKKTYWIKDGVRYIMLYDNGKPMVKMFLEYYQNPDGHNLGERPIIIQREDNVDGLVEGEKATVLLIGDKQKYTSRYFKNLYIVIGTKKGSYLGRMPKDSDGGLYPKLAITSIGGSKKLLIETDNEYTKWYTTMELKDNKLSVVGSSEKNPTQE